MARSLALATFLLFSLLWTATAWAEPESSAASFLVTGKTPVEATLGITARVAVTGGNVITVTTTDDEVIIDGDCSLREALLAAFRDAAEDACAAGDNDDTVYISAGLYQLSLGQLHLTGTVTLQGSITDTTILDGNKQSRVLYIEANANVSLLHLDIRNGQAPYYYLSGSEDRGEGGGISNDGTAWIAYSTIHGNQAGWYAENPYRSYGEDGGGIFNLGVLTVTNSTISNNRAGHGSGAGVGGGIANLGKLTLDNTTVAKNSPGKYSNTTYFGSAGGVFSGDSATTTLRNSIIADNVNSDCGGEITSLGNNVIETPDGCNVHGDFIDWVAYLKPLVVNGGPTMTHALDEKSPAIDAGDCTDSSGINVTVDQRGEPRPQGDGCDLGAYESPYTNTFVIQKIALPQITFQLSPCTTIIPACNLTHNPLHDKSPSWSPDGQKIAFARSEDEYSVSGEDAGIYLMNANGGEPIRLTDHGEQPVWSPDGSKIAFRSVRDGNPEIYVIDANGEHSVNLTNTPANDERDPIWSPDGSKILYFSHDLSGGCCDWDPEIYVMNADGSQKIKLATNSYTTRFPWSPDGSKIAFMEPPNTSLKIHIINVDGSNRIDYGTNEVFYHWPAWSPDGSKIAFQCIFVTPSYETHMCVMNSDGSNRLDFTMDVGLPSAPAWSPNGSKIAFLCDNNICLMNGDGSLKTNLTNEGYPILNSFVWSPDGSKLLFQQRFISDSYVYELIIINADGTQKRQLTETPRNVHVGDWVWSPDGSKIAFVSGVEGNREIYVLGIND